jgi:hypothetical protein
LYSLVRVVAQGWTNSIDSVANLGQAREQKCETLMGL